MEDEYWYKKRREARAAALKKELDERNKYSAIKFNEKDRAEKNTCGLCMINTKAFHVQHSP